MSQFAGFFNSVISEGTPDRPYDASHFADYFSSFIGNGVFAHNLNELEPVPSSTNLSVKVKSGRAYINGYWFKSTADETLSFEANANANPRWDAIVVRLNLSTRVVELAVKTGASYADYASGRTYIYNNITRTDSVYELCLAIVRVPEESSTYTFTTSDIYDVRAEEYCGWVTGLIDQIDISTMFDNMQAQFNVWFNQMKDQLSSDAAGSLQNQIDDLNDSLGSTNGNVSALEERVVSNYNEIDTLRQNVFYLMPFVMFQSTQGSSGTISLNREVTNFNELEIYYTDNNGRTTNVLKVPSPEAGKQVVLALTGDENNYTTYIRRATYTLGQSSMELKADSESLTTIAKISTSSTGDCTTRITYGQGQYIKILKVVGLGDVNYTPVTPSGYGEVFDQNYQAEMQEEE